MRKPRVVIVGAGPAGGSCALALARAGTAEVVLIDRAAFPRAKTCGSGLSSTALTALGRLEVLPKLADKAVAMPGVHAMGPSGTRIRLAGNTNGAWVVPRLELDAGIAAAAVRAGATFHDATPVRGLLREGDGPVLGVSTAAGDVEADFVVCANGSPSRFSHDTSPKTEIRTIVGWWRAKLVDDLGIMIWDRRLGGYYAWAFPEPDGIVNIGLTIPAGAPRSSQLRELFAEILFEHFGEIYGHAEQLGVWKGHPAVVTTRLGDITESHAMWIGEAARLVIPGTVEGIGCALESGMAAAKVLAVHLDRRAGLSRIGAMRYRASLAPMLPKFWAGETLVRVMRSQRVTGWAARHIDATRVTRLITRMVGDGSAVPSPKSMRSSAA